MIHHMCETWSQHTWWLCSRPGLGAPKSGCDRSGIKGMLTIGRNLDRNGHNHYLLTLLWFFLYLSWSCLTFYCSTLINLTFATLILSSAYLNLFSSISTLLWLILPVLSKRQMWILHFENPMPKVTFRNRRPNLRNKSKTIFVDIGMLECLFLWYLSDLGLWLSGMSCGVVSTIASTYT